MSSAAREAKIADQTWFGYFSGLVESEDEKERRHARLEAEMWSVADAADWRGIAEREDPYERSGSSECEAALAQESAGVIADHLSYRRDFEVIKRSVSKDGSRTKFVEDRNDPIIPLESSEVELLRALGYVED